MDRYSKSYMLVFCSLVAYTGLQVQAAVYPNQPSFLSADGRVPQSDSKPKTGGLGIEANITSDVDSVKTNLKCGVTEKVGSDTHKYERCPSDCPYFAQNRQDAEHCTFLCVPANDCAKWNANKPIADTIKDSKTCRGPMVQFCEKATLDGKDTCAKCQSGWALQEDGTCRVKYWTEILCGLIAVAVFVVVVIVWVVDWFCRPTINIEQVSLAEAYRSRSKIHKCKDPSDDFSAPRKTWPMSTNLREVDVAGPGMLLHFRFQYFMILWPLFVALTWTAFAVFHNELFWLGTRRFGTPRHNCILVAWGYETQHRLMWTKVAFLIIVYVVTFISFLLFSVSQYRKYQELDAAEKTMKDFALEIFGLPRVKGDQKVEEDLKAQLNEQFKHCNFQIMGVSVCWDYADYEDKVMDAVRKDQTDRKMELHSPDKGIDLYREPDRDDPTAEMGFVHKKMYAVEKYFIGPGDEQKDETTTQELLVKMYTSETAFVVFHKESDKDAAMDISKKAGLKFKVGEESYDLEASEVGCEPLTVNWQNFGDPSWKLKLLRFAKGFFGVYLPALAVWFFFFYVPYAWSLYNFNYDNGAELPGYYGMVFTIIVVGGNATMYVVCDICGDIIGFRYKDSKQVTYMLMYLAACLINVLLDMVVTYKVAKKAMIGYDFRTYHGKRLEEIEHFTDKFETYAMQRSLAENVFIYSFPSTFLIPFLLEPIVTVLVPYQLGKLIVRTHKEIHGACAEAYLAAFEFDLGRYADILLNVFLGILIFWFPGGYTWQLFYGMFISHIVIYAFDHWRVLDCIPCVKIVSKGVDWWAQVVMAGCCGMIMSALVFKANCESYSGYCIKDMQLIEVCTLAGFAHFVVHVLLLIFLVPLLGIKEEDLADKRQVSKDDMFGLVGKRDPFSWFSTNPVHCLRSQHIYLDGAKGKAYCRYASPGNEHLLEKNEEIGCYFADIPAEAESFKVGEVMRSMSTKGLFTSPKSP